MARGKALFTRPTFQQIVTNPSVRFFQQLKSALNVCISHIAIVGLLLRCFFIPAFHGEFMIDCDLVKCAADIIDDISSAQYSIDTLL